MAEPWKVGSRPRTFYFKQTKYGIIAPAVVSAAALATIAVVVANAQNETVTVFTKIQTNLLSRLTGRDRKCR